MKALEKIALLDSLFYVALGVALVGLIFAVFFFFYFDIPGVYALMSGRTRKKALEEMHERNAEGKSIRAKAETGSVRKRATGESGGLSEGLSGGLAYDPPQAEHLGPKHEADTVPLEEAAETDVLRPDKPETTLLKSRTDESEAGRTVILSKAKAEGAPEKPSNTASGQYNFRVREQVLLIHTQETI